MAQLIVRNIEDQVVARLRERAARRGVSAEEEHRRILREAVSSRRASQRNLKDYLLGMPYAGDDRDFERPKSRARPVKL